MYFLRCCIKIWTVEVKMNSDHLLYKQHTNTKAYVCCMLQEAGMSDYEWYRIF